MVVRLSALRTGRLYPPGNTPPVVLNKVKSYAEGYNTDTGPDVGGEQGKRHILRGNRLVKQPGYTQFQL